MNKTEQAQDLAGRALKRRNRQDAALLLPLFGILLFLSPLITLPGSEPALFGAPAVFSYIFGVWLVLIYLALRLARRLVHDIEGS
ncbi:MAG TPA: hypothetical protein VLA51_10100 [Paracoccaceae bacterium]|nr:hypothetical protein [Paracoccaceae bacterium]